MKNVLKYEHVLRLYERSIIKQHVYIWALIKTIVYTVYHSFIIIIILLILRHRSILRG